MAIDRAHQRRDLERAGADFVLDDVAELDLGASGSDPWLLVYEGSTRRTKPTGSP